MIIVLTEDLNMCSVKPSYIWRMVTWKHSYGQFDTFYLKPLCKILCWLDSLWVGTFNYFKIIYSCFLFAGFLFQPYRNPHMIGQWVWQYISIWNIRTTIEFSWRWVLISMILLHIARLPECDDCDWPHEIPMLPSSEISGAVIIWRMSCIHPTIYNRFGQVKSKKSVLQHRAEH